MRTSGFTLRFGVAALLLTALAGHRAIAAEYWLKAKVTSVTMPDSTVVAMWGYALCGTSDAPPPGDWATSCSAAATVPGPALTVPASGPGAGSLTVHLANGLPQRTSLIVHGLVKPMAPVWDNGSSGPRPGLTARVRSFDVEAPTGNGTADYVWSSVPPGTYLYQSGTQPQVQVQMGLYGALTRNAVDALAGARAQAYAGVGYEYDNQATLVYSEIDPALHAAVAGGTYGVSCPATNANCGNPQSTLGYAPKYFLINGQPYPSTSVVEPSGPTGTTLLRMLNAGLTTHVPMIQGKHWTLVAEDGKPYPYAKEQYTALLPAAKTTDVLLTADIGALYAIVDRRLSLSNMGAANGGMMAFLRFGSLAALGTGGGSSSSAPLASPDSYDSVTGVTLNIAAPGVLANDTVASGMPPAKAVATSGTTAGGGTYALSANGSFTYTPAIGYAGTSDSFTYVVTDGLSVSSPPATVTINLATPGVPTQSLIDAFQRADTTTGLGTGWSQTASTDAAPDIEVVSFQAKAAGVALGGLAIWGTLFNEDQGAAFTAPSLANTALVLKASGGTAAASPANLIRVRCEGSEVVVATMMGGSGTSTFAKQAAFAAAECGGAGTMSAAVDAKGLVTVFLGSRFAGGAQLPDVAVWKGKGRVGIQLLTLGSAVDNFSGGSCTTTAGVTACAP